MVRRSGIVIILFLMGLPATSALALEEKPDIWAPSESPWLRATRETIRLRMKSFVTTDSYSDERRGTFQKDRAGDIHVVSEFESSTENRFAQGLVVAERALLLEQRDNLDSAFEARAAALALLHFFYPGGAPSIPINAGILTLREDRISFYAFYRSASIFQPSGGNASFQPPWTVNGKVTQLDPHKTGYHFEIQKTGYAAILDGIWEVGTLQEGLPDTMQLKEWKFDTIMLPDFEGRMRKSNRLMLAEYPTLGELRRTLETSELPPLKPGRLGPPPQTEHELEAWLRNARNIGISVAAVRSLLEKADWFPDNPQLLDPADLDGDGTAEWFAIVTENAPGQGVPTDGPEARFWIIDDTGIVTRLEGKNFKLEFLADMTGDGKVDAVIGSSHCGAHTCIGDFYVMSQDGGVLRNIVATKRWPAGLINSSSPSDIHLTDSTPPDLVLRGGGIGSAGAGVHRERTETWGWNGHAVVLKKTEWEKTNWRHHVLYDGNIAYDAGSWDEAGNDYRRVISDASLQDDSGWGKSRESCEQFAAFRLVLGALRQQRKEEAIRWRDWLGAQHLGTPLAYAADLLLETWGSREDFTAACTTVGELLAKQSHPTGALENMGYGNPSLKVTDVCPTK